MNETSTATRSVVVEREFPFPPEKLWRALTQPHLLEEWLMKNDFKPVVDHRFSLRADWGGVDCQVLTIGQYLRPSAQHLPVVKWWHPDEFAELREFAESLGFAHVEAGPLVRSSYHAREGAGRMAVGATR